MRWGFCVRYIPFFSAGSCSNSELDLGMGPSCFAMLALLLSYLLLWLLRWLRTSFLVPCVSNKAGFPTAFEYGVVGALGRICCSVLFFSVGTAILAVCALPR